MSVLSCDFMDPFLIVWIKAWVDMLMGFFELSLHFSLSLLHSNEFDVPALKEVNMETIWGHVASNRVSSNIFRRYIKSRNKRVSDAPEAASVYSWLFSNLD